MKYSGARGSFHPSCCLIREENQYSSECPNRSVKHQNIWRVLWQEDRMILVFSVFALYSHKYQKLPSSFIFIATGKNLCNQGAYLKNESWEKAALEMKAECQAAVPIFIRKKCLYLARLSGIDPTVFTFSYVYDFRDIKNDADNSKLMTRPLLIQWIFK